MQIIIDDHRYSSPYVKPEPRDKWIDIKKACEDNGAVIKNEFFPDRYYIHISTHRFPQLYTEEEHALFLPLRPIPHPYKDGYK